MAAAIDVETLCRWAYREELAKRATSSAEGVWQRIIEFRVSGAMIDYNPGPQRYDLGVPDPDALVVEAAVARLPDLALDWATEAWDVLGDLTALVEPRPPQNAPAGRATSARWHSRAGEQITARLAPLRQVILVRTLRPAALVTAHAVMGTRPDWRTDPPRPQSVPSLRGHGPAIIGECRGRNYYSTGSYCPLTWEPSPIEVAEARADYLAWWRGLVQLSQGLSGQLAKWRVLPPACLEMPWRGY